MDREEYELKKQRAAELENRGEEFFLEGKLMAGLHMYQKAMNIYFDIGNYLKISDIFTRIANLLKTETTIFEALEYLRGVRRRLHRRDLPEEEAKVTQVMALLSYKVEDYASAAQYYEECADLFLKAEPEEYRQISAVFLIRAAECYELLGKHETGERILVLAALRLNPKSPDYQYLEYKGISLLKKEKFGEAYKIYRELHTFFSKALDNISDIAFENKTELLDTILIYAKTRLIYIICEYKLLLMICAAGTGRETERKEYGEQAIDMLDTGIQLVKAMIIKGIWNKEDLKRLTYMGFMAAYMAKVTDKQEYIERLKKNITEELPEQAVNLIKELPFYDLIVKIGFYSLSELHEELRNINLGRLERYKPVLGIIINKIFGKK